MSVGICWRQRSDSVDKEMCARVRVLQVRPGRSQRSKVVKNTANPVYDEEFFLLVDDFVNQKLSIKVGHP